MSDGPDLGLGLDWCYSHHRSEPIPAGGAFRVCGECGHCWVTRESFQVDLAVMWDEIKLPGPVPDDIPHCPLCAHDF